MEKYNLEKLVKVKVHDFWETANIIYKKEKNTFFCKQKEGFYYDCLYDEHFISEECPENHTLKDGRVYEDPEVILYFQSNIEKHYYFKTLKEAETFAKGLTDKSNWI